MGAGYGVWYRPVGMGIGQAVVSGLAVVLAGLGWLRHRLGCPGAAPWPARAAFGCPGWVLAACGSQDWPRPAAWATTGLGGQPSQVKGLAGLGPGCLWQPGLAWAKPRPPPSRAGWASTVIWPREWQNLARLACQKGPNWPMCVGVLNGPEIPVEASHSPGISKSCPNAKIDLADRVFCVKLNNREKFIESMH